MDLKLSEVFYMIKLPPLAARIMPRKFRIGHMTSVKFVSYSVMTAVK
jgi:hypothetical protein